MSELGAAAERAVEAALAAGVGDAEAYAAEETGREVRVHGGEIESLTAATQRGIGVRAWRGGRVGYAYGTDPSERGVAAIAARAAEAARIADQDEFAGPPRPEPAQPLQRLLDPTVAEWPIPQVAELALAVERAALAADPRIVGVETAVYADSAERVAIASSTASRASLSLPVPMPTCRRWPRARAAARLASASAWPEARSALTQRRSAPRGRRAP